MKLQLIIDTYQLFQTYKINIPQEDYDKVDKLALLFNQMMDNV